MFAQRFKLAGILISLMILASMPAFGQTPTVADGDEFLVNTYTTGNQFSPSTALFENGEFVVVWESVSADNGDASSSSVQGQRFDANGDPQGEQFLVNTYTTDSQTAPAIAAVPTGGFIVVWQSGGDSSDISGRSIQGQRHASDGTPLGDPFLVNTYTTNDQREPAVAVAGDGTFVVVWESDGDDGDTSNESIQGQRFASDGNPAGAQFLVNAYTTNGQAHAAVAMATDGSFVVVWESDGDNVDSSNLSVQGQRFDSEGVTLGGQFLVNTYTTSSQYGASVGSAPDGSFVVTWQSYGADNGDTSSASIQAQRYSSNGLPLGDPFLVNSYTTGGQRGPSVAVDGAGDFVVTWRSFGSDNGDTSSNSVQGQRYASSGAPIGAPFRVNTFVPGSQRDPSVALTEAGDFVVAWNSAGSTSGDTSGYSILGQRFRVTADLGDRAFQDLDSDGRQSVADLGAPGVTVHLRGALGDLVATTTTDADGAFLFKPKIGLQGVTDQFYLEFESGPFATFTTPDIGDDDTIDSDVDALGQTPTFSINMPGESFLDLDAGLISNTPVVGDRVWLDANFDGIQQVDETGAADITVRLLDELGAEIGLTTTNSSGLFAFPNVGSGTYRLEIVLPAGAVLAPKDIGDIALIDSDFDPVTRQTDLFAHTAAGIRRDLDAGVVLAGVGQTPTALEGEAFLVNSYTTGSQRVPVTASDAAGNFVIVWESNPSSGDLNDSVQGQRFSSAGDPIGGQFQVNSYTTGTQYDAAVAMSGGGEFVVTWDSYGYENGDTSYRSVQGQRFSSGGDPIGEPFRVNTYTTDIQSRSEIVMGEDGDFVVVFLSEGGLGDDNDSYGVHGKRYSSDGDPIGEQFQINSYTTNGQRAADIAAAANGDFVVVWDSDGSSDTDTSSRSVRAQRFASSGDPIGEELQVNTYTTDAQSSPVVAVDPVGGFVVAWRSLGSDNGDSDGSSIQARRFASTGNPLGEEMLVNTFTTGDQQDVAISMDDDGDFVVVWWSFSSDTDIRESIQAQRYASGGDPIGGQFQVNTYTTDTQSNPSVAMDAQGDFVVTWRDYRTDLGDGLPPSIVAQRVRVTAEVGDRVFFDSNFDGVQNISEAGVEGVVVHLRDAQGDLQASTTTDSQGSFLFKPKIAARGVVDQFFLEFEAPEGMLFTAQDVGDDALDSDADPLTGETALFIITSAGESRLDFDAGLVEIPLFADGFEAGDTSAWSFTIP